MAVELKCGVSQLELLYEQLTKEKLAKHQRKEDKKMKRTKKKEKITGMDIKENHECELEDVSDHPKSDTVSHYNYSDLKLPVDTPNWHKLQVLDPRPKRSRKCYCEDCARRNREISNNGCRPRSPEGSEGASSDCSCNTKVNGESHTCERMRNGGSGNKRYEGPGGMTLTLLQMLEESCSSDEGYITEEEIQEFKSGMQNVEKKRQELRERLKRQFDELCVNVRSFTRHPSSFVRFKCAQ